MREKDCTSNDFMGLGNPHSDKEKYSVLHYKNMIEQCFRRMDLMEWSIGKLQDRIEESEINRDESNKLYCARCGKHKIVED